MRRYLTLTFPLYLFVLSLVSGKPASAQDQCLTCHEAIEDNHAVLFKRGIHFQKGISCAGCHGGDATKEDMEEAMNPKAGFIGVPKGDAISEVCAKCHANASVMIRQYNSPLPLTQMESLTKSVHGESSTKARERIAQCTSCHDSHGILPRSNPRSPVHPTNIPATCTKCHANAALMRNYNPALPVDQLSKYRTSVHGKLNAEGDTKVAECASCHGNHEILSAKDVKSRVYPTNLPQTCATCHSKASYMRGYGIPSDQFDKYQKSVHGKALLEKNDLGAPACNDCHGNHGATPPGVESISRVCGTCHALNADLFSKSPHKRAFERRKLPECETCHGYHDVVAATDKLLGTTQGAVCLWCHSTSENRKGYQVAYVMRTLVDSLEVVEQQAIRLVDEAEQKGMEIGEAKFKLKDVRQARLETRTKVHSFNEEEFSTTATKGFTVANEVVEEARNAVDEYYFRRWGLVVATLIMTSLAGVLYLFIRRMEKKITK